MYKKHKIICIIPARGGSKGLPGKNIRYFFGKPLIAYTIRQAKSSKYIDRVIVSTDSVKIADIAVRHGAEAPFIRPKYLATDRACTLDVLLHAVSRLENMEKFDFDIIVLLHANAPLRKTGDIDNCIRQLVSKDADNIFSVTEAHRNPYFNMVEVDKRREVKLVKYGKFASRQAAPRVFDMNSSIYVWWKDVLKRRKGIFLKNTGIYVMPKERSVDIDDIHDWKIAELFFRKNRQ